MKRKEKLLRKDPCYKVLSMYKHHSLCLTGQLMTLMIRSYISPYTKPDNNLIFY